MIKKVVLFILSAIICMPSNAQSLQVNKESWGKTEAGEEVMHFTLSNKDGLTIKIMSLGCIITSIQMPDKNGDVSEITLGFNDLDSYLQGHPAFGAVMGRVTNRIKNARFTLDGHIYEVDKNMGEHHIHGASSGFNHVVWEGAEFSHEDEVGVEFMHTSPDGEAGYPGTVNAKVRYSLNNANELRIIYAATSDKPTIINMTNHAYFNLNGAQSSIDDHMVQVNAQYYTDADETAMPNGQILSVSGTPLNLLQPTRIGDRLDQVGNGFDHNYVIDKELGTLGLAAVVTEPGSGRKMEVLTTQPGVQLYTANWGDRVQNGRDGMSYKAHYGLCLETQHFPAAANYPHFPSTVLRPDEEYEEQVIFRFSVE